MEQTKVCAFFYAFGPTRAFTLYTATFVSIVSTNPHKHLITNALNYGDNFHLFSQADIFKNYEHGNKAPKVESKHQFHKTTHTAINQQFTNI